MILGVTPELATLSWPEETSLLAVDRNEEMIRALWPPPNLTVRASVRREDWRELPLGDHELDFVAGDGITPPLSYPGDLRAVFGEIGRVLSDRGRFVLRAFVGPGDVEDPDDVLADLGAGRIGTFHAFKLRLAMALQSSAAEGVRLADVWSVWHRYCPDPGGLAGELGWEESTFGTIDNYRDAPSRYWFPSLDELRELMSPHFVEVDCTTPSYELGERCPTIELAPRSGM
jgi:hypothetical protein